MLENPERPFTAIFGVAKFSYKIDIIERLFGKVDNILIGGGMAFTFLKAKNYEVGKSLLEADKIDFALATLKKAEQMGCKIVLPTDVVVDLEISVRRAGNRSWIKFHQIKLVSISVLRPR